METDDPREAEEMYERAEYEEWRDEKEWAGIRTPYGPVKDEQPHEEPEQEAK